MRRPERHEELRLSVREVCEGFPDAYWRGLDAKRAYPEEFVRAMSERRYLAALIPEEYGGLGMNLAQASVILEEELVGLVVDHHPPGIDREAVADGLAQIEEEDREALGPALHLVERRGAGQEDHVVRVLDA